MSEADAKQELEDLLRRLDEARGALVDALGSADNEHFETENADGESVKRAIDRTADEINFYYGRLVARALNLPQPPCLSKSDFGSLREATVGVQVAHKRFTNLLHDLVPEDLAKAIADPELGTFALRQVLEMAAAQYRLREQQVRGLATHAHSG